jgi:exopolyphosphatase / guanosine-5'-triphosphate,3'-diphosphate pyrophosphatase
VVARCSHGHPLVIRNAPADRDGHPFPTVYWLTCPDTVKAVSRIESEGWIKRLTDEAIVDPDLRTRLRRAHEAYARERGALAKGAEALGGVGGSKTGVKCLHAHYAFFLSGGPDPIGLWVARRLEQLNEPIHYEKAGLRLAVMDLGTNSIRLLVVRYATADHALTDLSRDMVITRLGQGVDRTGRIAPDALERTVAVMQRFARRARALKAERVRLSATSAVRDAANREELASSVLKWTGEPMEILSGEDEARTTFVGATRGLAGAVAGADAPPPYLVMDIGGGSTEFVVGSEDEPGAAVSMNIGSVRLTERFVRSDPPSYDEMTAVDEEIAATLGDVEDRVPVRDARTLVAVSGTSTTVQAIAMNLPEYDPERLHRTWLGREDAEHALRLLADMTTEERRGIPSMAPGREDVIPAGAAILVQAMRRWGFERALVSETDILDGLAFRLAEEMAHS